MGLTCTSTSAFERSNTELHPSDVECMYKVIQIHPNGLCKAQPSVPFAEPQQTSSQPKTIYNDDTMMVSGEVPYILNWTANNWRLYIVPDGIECV